ncbi:MAG: hypothetical protein ACOH18_02900 [Candidatus Saccharimonadaceae bacterium]
MSPEAKRKNDARRQVILDRSTEVLGNTSQTYGTQSIIVSEQEATIVGEAVATRNHRAIREVFGETLEATVEDYRATDAGECIGMWNRAIASTYGENIVLHDMLVDNETRELLNMLLTNSEISQLGLDTTEYLKLLETIAIITMPEEGFRSYPESRRSRTGGGERALFYRAISLLTSCADATPGIRTVREDILNTDQNALSKYLASVVKSDNAQASLEKIIEMDKHDIRRQKAGLERTVLDQQTDHDIEIDDLLHVLEWKMLNGKEESRETRHKRIQKVIEGQSITEFQKRRLYQDWCPERLDFLIEIAEMAHAQNRHASMYISNRFEEGAGVYVAVELDNPYDPTQKIVFADNPLSGNALYIVDEARLQNQGHPNTWRNVLGSSRRIARERGAIRKYHSKNWQDILPTIMGMGAELVTTQPEEAGIEIPDVPELTLVVPEVQTKSQSIDELISSTHLAIKRNHALVSAARELLS